MHRLIFVDDEVPILRALERVLRVHRDTWQCHFFDDPRAALDQLEAIAPDVVISDMLMPGLDGSDFLVEAARRRPVMACFILSGEVGPGSLLRMAGAAHQCLAKPCRADVLTDVLRHAIIEPTDVTAPALVAGLYGLRSLPIPAAHLQRLRESLARTGSDAQDAETLALIGGSAGIATKLLQVASWTRLGVGAPPVHVHDAFYQVGQETVSALLDANLLPSLADADATPFQRETWHRAERAAAVAAAMARADGATRDDARRVGLLALWSASAPLLLDAACREDYAAVRAAAAAGAAPRAALERQAFGVSAGQALARLLRLWGLPAALAESVAQCDDASGLPVDGMTVEGVAHVAQAMVGLTEGRELAAATHTYLGAVGRLDRLETWRVLADQTVAA